MATIVTRAGKGSALTFAEMDANFTNLNDELANVTLGALPENSISATELDNSGDFTVNTITTTGNVIVGDSLIPSSGNLELNTDYLVVSDASGTEKFKIRTDTAPGPDQVLKYNETTGFVQWASDQGQTSTQVQSSLDSQNLGDHADVDTTGVTDGQALVYVSANAQWEAGTVSGGVSDIVDDTTPQLGGDLDVNGNNIVSVSAGNVVIAPDSANSEGYSTATLDASSGHFFLKAGLVLDHPGTAGLDAQYSNYITVATTDGDLNMSSNGGGRIRPRSDFQIRGSDGCDLWLRSEFSTDAKISYRGGSTEQGALIVDRNNSEIRYYTNTWDQVIQSGGNIDVRATDRFQFRNKDSGTSEYNETMSLFQSSSGITDTQATGAVVESSSGKQSGDYDTSLVIRKFDEGDGGSTAHAGVEQRIAQYELTLEAGKSTLSLNYRDDDNTGAAQNSTTLIKFKNGTSETATAGTQNAPDQIELLKDVLIQGGATDGRYLVVDNFDGATPITFGYNSPGITIASKGTGDNRDFPGMILHNSSSNSGAYPSVWIQRNKNDDPGTTGYLADDERIFAFYGAADRASSYYNQVAGIEYRSSEAHSASAQGGKIEFYTMPNGTNSYNGQTKKMTIDEHVTMDNLLELKAYASGSLPTGVNGALISISDNNYKPAYYNGSTWKYIADDTDV